MFVGECVCEENKSVVKKFAETRNRKIDKEKDVDSETQKLREMSSLVDDMS